MTDRERLIELIRKAKKNTKGANCDLEREMLFADYLLENGVIVPPVAIGRTVYSATTNNKVKEILVVGMDTLNDETSMLAWCKKEVNMCECAYEFDGVCEFDKFCKTCFTENDIGKTVFLTREEAEKALAERSNKQ